MDNTDQPEVVDNKSSLAELCLRQGAKLVVGMGTASIVKAVIANNIVPETAKDKILIGSATVMIGFMAADAASDYTDRQVSNALEAFSKIRGVFLPADTTELQTEVINPE